MAVLIYFIHHIATSIQLPQVIASIARDLSGAIDADWGDDGVQVRVRTVRARTPQAHDGRRRDGAGAGDRLPAVHPPRDALGLAAEKGAVIRLLHRPGHFLVDGHPMATVWPPGATESVSNALRRAHITGPNRTLAQDMSFAVDQLVEIAIRALSPAVNDTFTALTCIDWLGASLCKVTTRWRPVRVHRDSDGYVRLITAHVSYTRLIERAFEKIRQAGRGMPAVMIRQLDALSKIIDHTKTDEQREPLLEQAAMILQASEESVPEPADRTDVRRQYEKLSTACRRAGASDLGAASVTEDLEVS